jgi:hypothetical protein
VSVLRGAIRWTEEAPWRPGLVFAAACWISVVSSAAGAVAWVTVAPFAAFVLGWTLWWYARRRTAILVLVFVVLASAAQWWIFGLAGGTVVTVLYTVGEIAILGAVFAGYGWGARRQRQGWALQDDASA